MGTGGGSVALRTDKAVPTVKGLITVPQGTTVPGRTVPEVEAAVTMAGLLALLVHFLVLVLRFPIFFRAAWFFSDRTRRFHGSMNRR